jgi:TolA-binding protein
LIRIKIQRRSTYNHFFFAFFAAMIVSEVIAGPAPSLQSLPPNVIVPQLNSANLLNGLTTEKAARVNATFDGAAKDLSRALNELVEQASIEIGSKSSTSKSRYESKLQRVHLYLEQLSWSGGRTEIVTAVKSNAQDILGLSNGRHNGLSTLIVGLLEPLYAGNSTSIDKFKTIITKKPTDIIAGEANLIVADYFFSKKDFKSARPFYLAALGHPKLVRRNTALVKLAWTFFDSHQTAEATATMKTVLANMPPQTNGKKSNRSSSQSFAGLLESPLRAASSQFLIRIYSELGNLDAGHAALLALGFKDSLASFYFEFGKTNIATEQKSADGIAALLKLITSFKSIPNADVAASLALDADLKYRRLDRAAKNLVDIAKNLRSFSQSIALKESVLRLADAAFIEAASRRSVTDVERSELFYTTMMKFSLDPIERTRLQWAMAELAAFKMDSKSSARIFLGLGQMNYKNFVMINYQNKAKFNPHKIALENAVALSSGSEAEIFIKSCDLLIKIYDETSAVISHCDAELPKIFLNEKNAAEAKRTLDRKIVKYTKAADSFGSIKSLFGFCAKNGEEQLLFAKKYLAIKDYADSAQIKDFLSTLEYDAELASIKTEKDPQARIQRLFALIEKFQADQRSPALLLETSKEAFNLNMLELAGTGFGMLVRLFSDKNEAEEATFTLAQLYENKFALEDAATQYQSYDRKYKGVGARSIIAKQKLCELSIVLELKQALDACRDLATRDKNSARGAIERLIAKAFYEGRVDYLQILIEGNYFKLFDLSPNDKIRALYKIYVANKRVDPTAIKAAREIKLIYTRAPSQVTDEALKYVAELFYREILFAKSIYDKLNLDKGSGQIENLVSAIEEKKRGLDNLQFQLTKIAQIGSANWSAAAYYENAEAHASFAQMLRSPPAIDGVKPVDVKLRLQPQALALEDAALRLYERALTTAWRFQIYNEFAVKAIDGQARLSDSPVRFRDWIESPIVFNIDAKQDTKIPGGTK